MTDYKIKHFVIIRFFPKQSVNYPHDIFDVDFLSKQLLLAKNAMASLDNQTNKNFEIVFVANERYFAEEKYEFIFSTLKASTTLPIQFIEISRPKGMYVHSKMPALVKEALNDYDFVIQSRMDFDDFIYKDAIADTQSKVNECSDILGYGYCLGYRYILGEMYYNKRPYEGNGHQGILQSLILKSSFAKNLPFLTIYSFRHDEFKLGLKKFLKKHGIEFSENMFQQNLETRAFIYFGHEFSRYFLTHNLKLSLSKKKQSLTNEDITKKQLEDEFGFFYELNSIK